MNLLLQRLQQHASGLPPTLQAELLNYAMYLEQRATTNDSPPITEAQRRQQLAEALEAAAALDPYRDVSDPVAWQRAQREDRPLLGRDAAD